MTLLKDEVFPLVQELSSTGLSATLIEAPERSSEGSKSSDLVKTLKQSKSSEECNPTRHTEDRGNEEQSISQDNDGKKQRYSLMSAEVYFTRDRPVIQKKMANKMDVRHVNITQKIKSSCLLSCDQQQCPKIQERFDQHKRIHHSKLRKAELACGTRTGTRDRAINVSPTLSRLRLPKFSLPLMDEGSSVQTDITMRDFSPTRLFIQNPANQPANDHDDNEIPLRKTETRDILPRRNFYKEHLQIVVLDWLRNVPMFFSSNFTTQHIKDNVVYSLVEKINALAVEADDEAYETKMKKEIDDCLNKLPMWLHGTKQEQILFKDSLKNKLWYKIIGLNKNFLGITYEKAVDANIDENIQSQVQYEKEMMEWSLWLQLDPTESVNKRQVIDLLMEKLSPLLKIPLHSTSYKLLLKGEIIDILDDLPLTFICPKYKTVQLNKLSEELANRLLSLQIKQEPSSYKNTGIVSPSVFHQIASQVTGLPIRKMLYTYKDLILHRVGKCLDRLPVCNRNDLKTEICSSFLDSKSCLHVGNGITMNEEISQFLQDTGKVSAEKAQIIANMIITDVKDGLKDVKKSATSSFDSVMPQLSGTISVYRWGSKSPPATSTPKTSKKKDVPKLNPEETTYTEKVAALITVWMNTLPKQYNEEPGFKKTVIYDLAGDIMDHQKLQQLAPDSVSDKEKYQKYLIYKWLCKFDFFEDSKIRTDSVPLVADFQRRLKDIPVPNLTASQHGTRQEMAAIKHMESEGGWHEDYVAKGIDVLEDQISVWMNEQPSEIYSNKDKGKRNKMAHDLALNIQDHLRSKNPESIIEADINQWLKKIVKPKEKEHINLLTQDLKAKIIDLPQDETLGVRHEERHREMMEKIAAKRQQKARETLPQHEEDVSNIGNIQGDPDRTIREFIGKYIEHYYDIRDPMTTEAFAQLLKTELRKLAPPTRKEVYENFEQLKTHQRFRPESLNNELEYIKIISDWLNNLPIDPSYNTVGNKNRIEFINDLARNFQEIEEQRTENPNAMNYNYLIASTILTSMNTYDLPIQREHRDNTPIMAHRLLEKLVDIRPSEEYAPQPSPGNDFLSSSFVMSDIKEQNLSDFINDYIRINGKEIADDGLKLEAWTARLLKEVKKMIHEDADPARLTKAEVYEKFAAVPIPTEESVEAFGLKKYYVKEITNWMKNLPLLQIQNQPEYAEEKIRMISELSEKMYDTEAFRRAHPSDNSADKKLEEYIATCISSLPLDKSKEIILPILVQKLMRSMEKGTKYSSKALLEIQTPARAEKQKTKDKGDSKQKISKKGSKDCSICSKSCTNKTPAEIIVEAIETWSNKLPIKLDDKDTVKAMKEGIARQLYQKIGELNVDPRIFNDELLYREMLEDEIETQLENVPQNSELQENREKIKEGLINQIIGTNKVIKEKSAGGNYRHKLETTIDASIPNPVQSVQAFDPGFEIYKNHLADMFILENFDHGTDDVKVTYEKRVRHEIDKHFESARNKNALPLTKDQLYNEIYSALFKVPMPNEKSVIDEVELVKTRCEVDVWYEKLPLQETDNINELLERDQILSTLAKRIQEIEKDGCNVDEKLYKETRKWLEKLPLKLGQQGIDEHVKRLQNLLKSTAAARKYVPPETVTKGKIKQVTQSKGKQAAKNTSQAPGPSAPPHPSPPPPRTSELQSKATTAKPCCPPVCSITNKKSGDLIVEIVEEWCNQLPLISTEKNNKAIIDNIATRIIIQISEFNMDAEIFNDDIVYDELLDEELENVLANLPVCCDFEKSKTARKYQLKEQIKSIKPLIKEEKARHDYKQELNRTVASILKEPHDTAANKLAAFNKLKEEIVEDFVQYYYHINDEETRKFYKNQIHDGVVKFCIQIRDTVNTGEKVDPLVRRNQLLCELQKILVPQSALKEEVTEIKMKKEVEQFLREQSIPEGDAKDTMTKHLAKRLCDVEKSGHSPSNENKMKSDIIRCVTKLKKEITPEAVAGFVNKLKLNEAERKAPPITSSQASLDQETEQRPCMVSPVHGRRSGSPKPFATCQPGMAIQRTSQTPQQRVGMPQMRDTTYHTHAYEPQVGAWSPNEEHPEVNLSENLMDTEEFEAGNILASSAFAQGIAPRSQTPPCLASVADRPAVNLNTSLGSAQPSPGLRQQSLRYPQRDARGMREASSGFMLSHPSVSQNATPRQVGQSPRASHAQESTSLKDTTSDSLFQAPTFEPVPYAFIDPSPLVRSGRQGAGRQGARRPLVDQDNARTLPMQAGGRPIAGDRRPRGVDSSDDDEICVCERCSRRNPRGIRFCLVPLDYSFEDCVGIPMFYGLHFPDCLYY